MCLPPGVAIYMRYLVLTQYHAYSTIHVRQTILQLGLEITIAPGHRKLLIK